MADDISEGQKQDIRARLVNGQWGKRPTDKVVTNSGPIKLVGGDTLAANEMSVPKPSAEKIASTVAARQDNNTAAWQRGKQEADKVFNKVTQQAPTSTNDPGNSAAD